VRVAGVGEAPRQPGEYLVLAGAGSSGFFEVADTTSRTKFRTRNDCSGRSPNGRWQWSQRLAQTLDQMDSGVASGGRMWRPRRAAIEVSAFRIVAKKWGATRARNRGLKWPKTDLP
jgi:hypothetical protein